MLVTIIDFFKRLIISVFSGFANKRKGGDATCISITRNKKSRVNNVQIEGIDNKGKINIKGNIDSEIENIGIK